MDDEIDEGFEDSSIALAISEDMETIGTGEDPTQDDAYEGEEGEDEEDDDNDVEEPEQVCIHIVCVVYYMMAISEWWKQSHQCRSHHQCHQHRYYHHPRPQGNTWMGEGGAVGQGTSQSHRHSCFNGSS